MSSNERRSQSPCDNPLAKNPLTYLLQVPTSHGAIPKIRSTQQEGLGKLDESTQGFHPPKHKESRELSLTPHKDKAHSDRKHHKTNQSETSEERDSKPVAHKDRLQSERNHKHHTDKQDGTLSLKTTNERVKRETREPKSASQKDRPHTERRYGDKHDELVAKKSNVEKESKPTQAQKIRPHTERRHQADKRDDKLLTPKSSDERRSKPTENARPHSERRHHGDKRDDKSVSPRSSDENEKRGTRDPSSTLPKGRQQSERKQYKDEYEEVPVKPEQSETNVLRDKRKKKPSSTLETGQVDQKKQPEKYEGLPLAPNNNEASSTAGSRSHKSVPSNRGNSKHKHKKDKDVPRSIGTSSYKKNSGSGKIIKGSDDISLIFPDEDGTKSVMRVVVRSFASPTKSQNCIDVQIQGEKFNSSNIENPEVEMLIRQLTKYVIQIQKKLEEGDKSDMARSEKSKKGQRECVEVVELFRRAAKSSKEIEVIVSKSKQGLNISLKHKPSSPDKKESKPECEKISSHNTHRPKRREHSRHDSSSENSDDNKSSLAKQSESGEVGKISKGKKDKREENPDSNRCPKKKGEQESGMIAQDGKEGRKRESDEEGKESGRKGVSRESNNTLHGRSKRKVQGNEDGKSEAEIDVGSQEKRGIRKRGSEDSDDNVNPKKPKSRPSSETTHQDTKKEDQTNRAIRSKVEASQASNSTAGTGQDAQTAPERKISLGALKDSVSKMLVKYTASKTVVAEGPTAAIRRKHKAQGTAERRKDPVKKQSRSKLGQSLLKGKVVQIPVVFEEVEPANQSKSSIKINMEHSTNEGNLRLHLVGIRNDDTQEFGGRIHFTQSFTNPKKKCEDVETMKELLSNCVKKVENVLNNLCQSQNEIAKYKHSQKERQANREDAPIDKTKDKQILEHELGPKPEGIIKRPSLSDSESEYPSNTVTSDSNKSLQSNSSKVERRISFKEEVDKRDFILPQNTPDGKLDGEENEGGDIEDECFKGECDGECNECVDDEEDDEDEELTVDKDVNEIVQAKLHAGEFDKEVRRSFQRDRFSVTLKDADALERYKRQSQSKLDIIEQQEESTDNNALVPLWIENDYNSHGTTGEDDFSSKTNLALSFSAEDKLTTTLIGLSSWSAEFPSMNQTARSASATNIESTTMSEPSQTQSNADSQMARSASATNIEPTTMSEPSQTQSNTDSVGMDTTPENSIYSKNLPMIMIASVPSHPIDADLPKDEKKPTTKNKGCCQLL